MKYRHCLGWIIGTGVGTTFGFAVVGCTQTQNAYGMRNEWNTNYLVQPTYNVKPVKGETRFEQAFDAGGRVTLANGTTWVVQDADQRNLRGWRPDAKVIVVESTYEPWPYTIINLDTHDASSVDVRPAQSSGHN